MSQKVLIVEGLEPLQKAYSELFDEAGYDVSVAEDALTAVQSLPLCWPDLILLDINLPLISGWDLLHTIRRTPQWQDIPVILVSGLDVLSSPRHGWLTRRDEDPLASTPANLPSTDRLVAAALA